MPFSKKKLFEQSHSVDLCAKNRMLFLKKTGIEKQSCT